MKRLINCIISVMIVFTASLGYSNEKIFEEEEKIVIKIKQDLVSMLEILEKTSKYLDGSKRSGSFNELMVSIEELQGGYNYYYSSSLAKNEFFKKCLIGALYTGMEDYGNLLAEYNSCYLTGCKKNALNRELVILQARHIRKVIGVCQTELNVN